MEIIEINIDQNYASEIQNAKGDENGIAYAMYLRRVQKIKNPILFKSTNDIETVLEGYPNSNIINAIGHSFLQLPQSVESYNEAIKDLNAVNDIQLSDIIINYCGIRSALINIFHEFKNDIKAANNKDVSDIEKASEIKIIIQDYRVKLLKEYPENANLIKEYDRITGLFNENEVGSIDKLLVDDKSLATTIATEDEDTPKDLKQFDWEVLLLDDNELEIVDVKKELEDRNIKVHPARTVEEAKAIINQDVNNKITVAISDYRLYKNPSDKYKIMQPEQGYDFLIWLSQQNRFTARVALSGLSKQFLMDSFRKYSANVKVYSKTDLVHNGLSVFADDIEDLGEYYEEVKNSIPTATNWKYLKPYYIAYKKLSNADALENYISLKADEIIDAVKKQIDTKTYRTEIDKWQQCRDYLIDCRVGDTQTNFDNSKYRDINDDNLDSFYCKLINRRVLIYFLIYDVIDKEVLCWLLHKGVIAEDGSLPEEKSQKDNKKQVFNNQSLKESDIPINILLEEKQWLSSMGINVNGFKVELDNFHSLFESFFNYYSNSRIVKSYKENFSNNKSIKHFKNNTEKLLVDITASEPREEGKRFITALENTVRKMSNYFPQNDDINELLKKIQNANRR